MAQQLAVGYVVLWLLGIGIVTMVVVYLWYRR